MTKRDTEKLLNNTKQQIQNLLDILQMDRQAACQYFEKHNFGKTETNEIYPVLVGYTTGTLKLILKELNK